MPTTGRFIVLYCNSPTFATTKLFSTLTFFFQSTLASNSCSVHRKPKPKLSPPLWFHFSIKLQRLNSNYCHYNTHRPQTFLIPFFNFLITSICNTIFYLFTVLTYSFYYLQYCPLVFLSCQKTQTNTNNRETEREEKKLSHETKTSSSRFHIKMF